jgi:lipoprotein-anchoring transpeptidase ErfK/SrfK
MRRASLTSLAAVLLAAVASAGLIAPAQAAVPAVPTVPVTQPLVILLQDHVAHASASRSARVIEPVAAVRPLTKVRTVLPVMGAVMGKDGNRWVHVRLPGRPSGHTGWILADQTIRSSSEWRIVVQVSTHSVTVYRDGFAVRAFQAVVPKASTPTPYGQFFVEEGLAISPPGVGGPFALAISARSDIFQEFEGGPGQIAIHGTDGLSDPLGSAASHGCIRVSPSAITWLARRIGAGVPVTVQP